MRHRYYLILLPVLLLGCLFNTSQEGPCYPENPLLVVNPIPDTTVAVGDTLIFDLKNPPVFSNGEDLFLSFDVVTINNINGAIFASIVINPNRNNNRFSLLQIVGERAGEAVLQVEAVGNDCLENKFKFKVEAFN